MQVVNLQVNDQELLLSSLGCVYWPAQKKLIVADTHLGKTGHFRKAGIAVPVTMAASGLQKLSTAIEAFQPEELWVLGDMFHSYDNHEHELFVAWRNRYNALSITLIKGNHDVLSNEFYTKAGVAVQEQQLMAAPFCLVHEKKQADADSDLFYLSGHIHPVIKMAGVARQRMVLPCFWVGVGGMVLPAFGTFTGGYIIKPRKTDRIYAIGGAGAHIFPI